MSEEATQIALQNARKEIESKLVGMAPFLGLTLTEAAIYSHGHAQPGSITALTHDRVLSARNAQEIASSTRELAAAMDRNTESNTESSRQMVRLTRMYVWITFGLFAIAFTQLLSAFSLRQ